MDCRDFLESYSDFLDGSPDVRPLADHRRHVEGCPSCAQYDRVVRKGLRLVQELPAPEPTPDFRERLQHKLFHVRDEVSWSEGRVPGATGVAAAIMVGLLLASTLSVVRPDGEQVELPPVVIEAPTRTAVARTASDEAPDAPAVPGVFTRTPVGATLLIVPSLGEEPWLVMPASDRVRLFRAPLIQARSTAIRQPATGSGE